ADASRRRLWTHARVEHWPDLGLALESGPVLPVKLHELGRYPDRIGPRVRLYDGPAADHFLALGEWTVCHGDLAVGEAHADAVLARKKAPGIHEGAVPHRLLYELAHCLHQRRRRGGRAVRLGMADERQVFHGSSLGGSMTRRTSPARIDMGAPFFL